MFTYAKPLSNLIPKRHFTRELMRDLLHQVSILKLLLKETTRNTVTWPHYFKKKDLKLHIEIKLYNAQTPSFY